MIEKSSPEKEREIRISTEYNKWVKCHEEWINLKELIIFILVCVKHRKLNTSMIFRFLLGLASITHIRLWWYPRDTEEGLRIFRPTQCYMRVDITRCWRVVTLSGDVSFTNFRVLKDFKANLQKNELFWMKEKYLSVRYNIWGMILKKSAVA